ncbi:MAG: hypothetical protein HN909_09485 [Phycisphaerales bacterium]|jgi:hypothetical protein|nr:hypothetical protein [Phycisphaerales bacterium]MBT7171982.1 hypothetical protein [Phycisphaerales bacterium]
MRTICLWMCGVILCGATGCAPIAWLQTAAGNDDVPAEFTFHEEPPSKVLVLVDDPREADRTHPVVPDLMRAINSNFDKKELAASTIPYDSFKRYSTTVSYFQQRIQRDSGILKIAEALEVTHVLIVRVEEFRLVKNMADSVYEPLLEVSCRILNVHDEEQVWPRTQMWFHVDKVDLRTVPMKDERHFASKMVREMAQTISGRITDLFRTSPGRDPSSFPKENTVHPDWDHPTGN